MRVYILAVLGCDYEDHNDILNIMRTYLCLNSSELENLIISDKTYRETLDVICAKFPNTYTGEVYTNHVVIDITDGYDRHNPVLIGDVTLTVKNCEVSTIEVNLI